ncbi:sensor histidine kinase [Lentzea sp. DG1S-22]|uniref:sensor histidine kinase n=1 Tax=Lentzea sp. DG1S-22 TaxID=3108822 RepID=UPI002E7953B1|nr:sensor histidine kinase [Lentzea sp. DG1S-22]WVH82859.1 sensor histidine kinase [Lentzea sp. DG1S-22]
MFAGAAVVVVSVLGLVEHRPANPVVMIAASVAVASPLLLRRRFPLTTAFASAAIVVVVAVPDWAGRLAAMAAFGSAAYHRPRRTVFVLAAAGFLVLAAAGVRSPTAATWTDLLLLGIAPAAAGSALRMHRDRADQAERLYREETRRVIAEEHARIAREVHDAVGHHLTVIRMQANAVRHVARSLPAVADRALVTIAEVSATALTEVRDVLAALPTHGTTLADLDALVDHVTGPNRTVTLTRDGPAPGTLPPLVDHAGYRLAQEALTNALRHSDASRVDLRLHHTLDAVVITVADNGSTTPGPATDGTGLRGIRERTRLLGGTLRIEPNRPSGWLVEARLPLGEQR